MKSYKLSITLILFLAFVPAAVSAIQQVGPSSWPDLITKIALFLLEIAIAVAVIVIIWSGILFMTAGGSEERVSRAKKTFFWALVGLAVCLIGMGFVDLVRDVLEVGGSSSSGSGSGWGSGGSSSGWGIDPSDLMIVN